MPSAAVARYLAGPLERFTPRTVVDPAALRERLRAAAREIALAFGVPPMLLGIQGDNTYANYAEANRAFFRQAVVPMASRLAEALTGFLAPHFADLRLAHDLDQVEALAADRDALLGQTVTLRVAAPASARAAMSSISSTVAIGTGVGRNARTERREVIASSASMRERP